MYVVAKMPFVFTHVEYCDMHFVYGFCDGNARAAVDEYRRRFPGSKDSVSKCIYANSPDTAGQWLFSKSFCEL